jgi:formate dehydrogenase subunit gamma
VHGVISFYHYFREQPPGRCVVQVCRAEACKAMRGDKLAEALRKKLRVDFGETRADGAVSLESVYCLGNCAIAPSVTVGGIVYGRCRERDVDELLASWGVPP